MDKQENSNSNQFAKNFNITDSGDYKIVEVNNLLDNSSESYKYILYKNEQPKDIENAIFIKLPIKSAACLSTTHIAMIAELEAGNIIKGATNTNLIYNTSVVEQVKNQEVKELGFEGNLNYETLLDLNPDIVFTYGLSDLNQVNKLKSLGLKPVVVAEFREKTPLARAEWIKFFAAFLEKESKATTIFNEVSQEYQSLSSEVTKLENRPTVFTGIPFQGVWYVPTGESYLAKYINDAGGDYLWKDSKGSLSLSLDLEAIFAKAQNAEKWLDVGFVFSKADVEKSDNRMANFEAFGAGEMYNYTKRVNANGGFDIYESAIVYPNIVLKDFVKILQPQLLPEQELYYYEQMK
jgi:iron complex transport system substrate-binding protein